MNDHLPQRQDSLFEQLMDVVSEADRMGCRDAADWIREQMQRPPAMSERVRRLVQMWEPTA